MSDDDLYKSRSHVLDLIEGYNEGTGNKVPLSDLIEAMANLHSMQAQIIRAERAEKETALTALEVEIREHQATTRHGKAVEDLARDRGAVIEAIKVARSNHPECDVHPDDDPVTCGWKRAVQDIDKALANE